MRKVTVSIVIPVLNDAVALSHLLTELNGLGDGALEIIVVDGGSADDSLAAATRAGAAVVESQPGRGWQLNAGYLRARGDWIWMLHADSRVSLAALTFVKCRRVPGWGRFDVGFEPNSRSMRVIAGMMNWRSRLSGICTGDQGIFAHRLLLARVGGVPEQPLMEDIELSRRLRRLSGPVSPRVRILTAARRWQRRGVANTVLAMWRLRFRYWLGCSPDLLARDYYERPG